MESVPIDGKNNRPLRLLTRINNGWLEIVFEPELRQDGVIPFGEVPPLPSDPKDAKGVLCGRRLMRHRGPNNQGSLA